MYQKILNSLKTKYNGVSDNILSRIAKKLANTITTEEDVETAVEGVTFQQILESYGDSRATEAQATAVKNYEAKHKLKDGKPVADPEPAADPAPSEVPEWAKQLIESNKALQSEVTAMKGEKTASERKVKLDGIIAKLPESLRKGYGRINLAGMTDEEYNNTITEVETEVESILKENGAKSAIIGRPKANPGPGASRGEREATEEEAKAVVSRMNF